MGQAVTPDVVARIRFFHAFTRLGLFDVRFADLGSNTSRFDASREGHFLIPVDMADPAGSP